MLISGCSQVQPTDDNFDNFETHEQPIAEYEEVYTLGLYDDKEFEYERTFNIEDNFQKSVILGNKTSTESSFVLLIFNHGEQINFEIDNSVTDHYIFDVGPGEHKEMEVSLSDLNDGFHSITYILLNSPEVIPEDYPTSIGLSDLFSIRVNLFKNIDNIPEKRPELSAESIQSEERKIHGTLLSNGDKDYEVLFEHEMGENNPITLFYGNSNSESIDFYLVSLLNFQQVPIGDDKYIYDELGPDEEKSITIKLEDGFLDNENNVYQTLMIPPPFEAVTEEDPYLLQDPLASNRAQFKK